MKINGWAAALVKVKTWDFSPAAQVRNDMGSLVRNDKGMRYERSK